MKRLILILPFFSIALASNAASLTIKDDGKTIAEISQSQLEKAIIDKNFFIGTKAIYTAKSHTENGVTSFETGDFKAGVELKNLAKQGTSISATACFYTTNNITLSDEKRYMLPTEKCESIVIREKEDLIMYF